MSGSVLTYDPQSVKIIISDYVIPGAVSVGVEWKSKPFTVIKGIRGSYTRVRNTNMGATIAIELLPTSIGNDVMSQIITQDRINSSARVEIVVKDTAGTTLIQSTEAFVSGFPNVRYDAEGIQTHRWDIEVLSFVTNNIGGNAQNGIDINDILSKPLATIESFADGLLSTAGDFVDIPVF
ncbi:hypothetical protein D3C80_526930 [compost metagenome]